MYVECLNEWLKHANEDILHDLFFGVYNKVLRLLADFRVLKRFLKFFV